MELRTFSKMRGPVKGKLDGTWRGSAGDCSYDVCRFNEYRFELRTTLQERRRLLWNFVIIIMIRIGDDIGEYDVITRNDRSWS